MPPTPHPPPPQKKNMTKIKGSIKRIILGEKIFLLRIIRYNC